MPKDLQHLLSPFWDETCEPLDTSEWSKFDRTLYDILKSLAKDNPTMRQATFELHVTIREPIVVGQRDDGSPILDEWGNGIIKMRKIGLTHVYPLLLGRFLGVMFSNKLL